MNYDRKDFISGDYIDILISVYDEEGLTIFIDKNDISNGIYKQSTFEEIS